MMKNWRSNGQEGSWRRSYNGKPPVPRGTWKPTVPTWEKKFCKAVGSLDWKAFLDRKQYVYLYDKILNWDDSAGEEAFCSAKSRFWAKLNGIPFNVDVPDPDLYIDDIDWECQIDEGLLLDLDYRSVADSDEKRDAVANSDEKRDAVIIFGDALLPHLPFSGIGWGTGWGDEEDIPKGQGNQQECTYEKTVGSDHGNGVDDCANNTWHLGKGDGWKSAWDQSQNMNPDFNSPKNRNYGSDGFWRKRDNVEATRTRAGMPRHKISNFPSGGQKPKSSWNNYKGRDQENYAWEQNKTWRRQPNGGWNQENYAWEQNNTGRRQPNGGWNQENYAWEKNNTGRRQPNGGWNGNACIPNTRQDSDNGRQTWKWKKSVS